MKIYPKQFEIRKLCRMAGISTKTLYREAKNLLKDRDLVERVFEGKEIATLLEEKRELKHTLEANRIKQAFFRQGGKNVN